MSRMRIHTVESAPAGSRPVMEQVQQMMGAVPNLAAGMAEAPTFIRGFFTLREIYTQGTLTAPEIEALSISNARENGCNWCVAFHTRSARANGLSDGAITALRAGELPEDPRLRAMVELSRELIRKRGNVSPEVLQAFYKAGLTPAQALEVVLGSAFSLLANFAGHLIDPPLDEGLKPFAWSARDAAAAR